ncbi:MAG: TfoX/Sxy family protein [Verrucomicrobiaceae bacterium]
MAYDTTIADRVTDMLVARRATFYTKAMFGGLCFMVNDKMCLGVVKAALMVRLDPDKQEDALKEPGCSPMEFTGRPMKGFVFVDAAHLDSETQLRHWVNLALEFNPRATIAKKRSKRAS